MKKSKKNLPFKKRNDEDFLKMTESIQTALNNIRSNPKIAATQDKLANLAGCSRKTLHNREGVIKELKQIKLDRKTSKSILTENILNFNKNENKKTKEKLIENYQSQNALLFDKIQDLEDQIRELSDINIVLREDKQVLLAENAELRGKLRKMNNSLNPPTNVIDIKQ